MLLTLVQDDPQLQNVKLIPYPYSGKRGTGRGIDEYCNFIINGLRENNFNKIDLVPTSLRKFSPFMILMTEISFTYKLSRVKGPVYHFLSPVGAKTAAIIGKQPFIVTINDVIPFVVKGFHPIRYFILRRYISISVKSASKVIVPFNYTKQFLTDKLKISDSKIEVINYWIDQQSEMADLQKMSHDFKTKKYLIFFGSHNAVIRGGDIAIKTIANLQKYYPDLSLKIVLRKDSKDYRTLKRLAYKFSVSDNVEFIDFLKEQQMNEEIKDAVAVLYPSRLGYGYIFTKSIQLGTPVISSSSLDMKDFENFYEGLCPENDINCYSLKVKKIIEEPAFNKSLLKQGYEILKSFNPDIAIQKMVSIYQQYV